MMMTMMILLCDEGCEAHYGRYCSGLSQNPAREVYRPQVSLPGESQGRGSLVGCRLWGRTESDMTEAT